MKKISIVCILLFVVAGAVVLAFLKTTGGSSVPPVQQATAPVDLVSLAADAASGKPEAQFKYGKALLQPGSTKPDYKTAAEWLKKSSDNSNTDATSLLGELTMGGQGVPRDQKAAVELFRKAAEKGNVSAQYNLGYCYERGTGIDNDEKEATRWYQLAAEGGDATAQFDVAQRFELGLGAQVELASAYKWYSLAANQGQPDAQAKLAALTSKLDSAQVKEGKQRVAEFSPRK